MLSQLSINNTPLVFLVQLNLNEARLEKVKKVQKYRGGKKKKKRCKAAPVNENHFQEKGKLEKNGFNVFNFLFLYWMEIYQSQLVLYIQMEENKKPQPAVLQMKFP